MDNIKKKNNKQVNIEFVKWNCPEFWKINLYTEMPAFCHEGDLLASTKDDICEVSSIISDS